MLAVTHAVELAWQVAAEEAIRSGHTSIEPLHLLAGVCSTGKLLEPNSIARTKLKISDVRGVNVEWQTVASVLIGQVDLVTLRRDARKALGCNNRQVSRPIRLNRSEASHRIFDLAEQIARDFHRPKLSLIDLFTALLGSDDPALCRLLGQTNLSSIGFKSALRQASEKPPQLAPDAGEGKDKPSLSPGILDGESARISLVMDASKVSGIDSVRGVRDTRRLALFYDLPLEFGLEVEHSALLNRVLGKIAEGIPSAERAALLVRDRKNDSLLLQAHVPAGEPAVSLTLAERAMAGQQGFIWNRLGENVTPSLSEHRSEAGMYAPLLWRGKALGAVCVDNCKDCHSFDEDDLRLLVAIAHHAAMAIANHQLQEDLRHRSVLLERMLTNFSPRVRQKLLEKATHGRLALGGEKSEVTILFSDIRGFTHMTASMDAEDIVEMLNHYFSVLVETVFRYDGTIDKFIGDAILAVFGSPEPDADQHEKAVRAAVEMQSEMAALNRSRAASGQQTCEIGIGVHCGEVLHGFIGSADRMEFTVVGDPVNRAARYCAGAQGGEVLISSEMHQRVWRQVEVEARTIATKHEGDFSAFRLKSVKRPSVVSGAKKDLA